MKTGERQDEKMFSSFLWTRFIAAVLLLTIGIADLLLLGYYIGNPDEPVIGIYIGQGAAFFLGGFSFFYPVGFPALLIGFNLLMYVIISKFRGKIERKDGNLIFKEKRLLRKQTHIIPESEIEGIRYQNTNVGAKYFWAVIFVPMIIMILQWGVPLFGEARMEDQILPTMMTLTAIIDGIVLFLLMFRIPSYMEIVTKDRYYETWFQPNPSKKGRLNEDLIAKDLNIEQISTDNNTSVKDFSVLKSNYFGFTIGILLFSVAIISAIFEIMFGTLFWMMAGIYGLILMVKSLYSDFNTSNQILYIEETHQLQMIKRYTIKNKTFINIIKPIFEYNSLLKVKNVSLIEKQRKIGFIELFAILWLIFMGSQQITYSWLLLQPTSPAVIVDTISATVLFSIIFILLFLYFTVNIPQLDINSASFQITKELSQSENLYYPLKEAKLSIQKTIQKKETKKIFVIRIGVLLFFILAGILSAITTIF